MAKSKTKKRKADTGSPERRPGKTLKVGKLYADSVIVRSRDGKSSVQISAAGADTVGLWLTRNGTGECITLCSTPDQFGIVLYGPKKAGKDLAPAALFVDKDGKATLQYTDRGKAKQVTVKEIAAKCGSKN